MIDIIQNNFKGLILFNEPMSKHTSYGIGGPAEIFAQPHDKEDLKRNFMLLDGKIYIIGLFIVFLYTIPILNLVAPMIGNIFTSHLILGNKLTIKKK